MRLAALVAFWLVASTAFADTFVVAPPYYQGENGRDVSRRISEVVADELADQQHRVLGPVEAVSKVPRDQRVACSGGDCAEVYRRAHGAVAAVTVRVYRTRAGVGPATSFQVGIQPQPGLEYAAGGSVDESLKESVRDAIREALRAYRRGAGPWLSVTGAPKGAAIDVDGRVVGVLPTLVAVSVGSHRVTVKAEGFEQQTRIVAFSGPTSAKDVEFRLEPKGVVGEPAIDGVSEDVEHPASVASPSPEPAMWDASVPSRRSARTWLGLGASALAVGLVSTALAVRNAVRSGDCAETRPGALDCDRYEFGDGSWANLGVGLGMLGLGAAASAVGVRFLRVRSEASTEQARLIVEGAF